MMSDVTLIRPKPQTLMKSLTDLCFASFADRGVHLG